MSSANVSATQNAAKATITEHLAKPKFPVLFISMPRLLFENGAIVPKIIPIFNMPPGATG